MAIHVETSASIPIALPACWFCDLHKQANHGACPLKGKAFPLKWCAWLLRDTVFRGPDRGNMKSVWWMKRKETQIQKADSLEVDAVHL